MIAAALGRSGQRGGRDEGCASLLRELTGCAAATVVNNNAAATLFTVLFKQFHGLKLVIRVERGNRLIGQNNVGLRSKNTS